MCRPDGRVENVLAFLSGRLDSHPTSAKLTQGATDAILHVPWGKLRRWAPPTCYNLIGTTSVIMKI